MARLIFEGWLLPPQGDIINKDLLSKYFLFVWKLICQAWRSEEEADGKSSLLFCLQGVSCGENSTSGMEMSLEPWSSINTRKEDNPHLPAPSSQSHCLFQQVLNINDHSYNEGRERLSAVGLPNHVGSVGFSTAARFPTFFFFLPASFYPSENLQPKGNEVLPLSLCIIEIFIWIFE